MINYFYEPYIDLSILIISIAMIIILFFTYTKKNFQFKLLFTGLFYSLFASIFSILYNYLLQNIENYDVYYIYFIHDIFYTLLISIWVFFIIYLSSLRTELKEKKDTIKYIFNFFVIIFSYTFFELTSSITKFGFYIEDNIAYEHFLLNPFMLYYVVLGTICIIFFIKNKKLFPKKVFFNISFLFFYCITIMISQGFFNTTMFNTLTFFIPVLTIFYILHSNSFDSETGTLGPEVFYNYISESLKKQNDFTIITIKIYENNISYDENINTSYMISKICRFCDFEFNKSMLFQKNKYLINIITKNTNKKEVKNSILNLQNFIHDNFTKYNLKTKIVVLRYTDELEKYNAKKIIELNKYIINKTKIDTIYECQQNDIKEFNNQFYIVEQLKDITIENNLDDPRVIVYCQPILNTNNLYKNAEVLMRLELPEIGLVYPNEFIPIAEKYKMIHSLSLIILNKTCKEIKSLLDEGYEVDRFSVNFSANEFNMISFYDEIVSIVNNIGIPFDKLAFEITETTFNKIDELNKIMNELKNLGIIFYLDDFGTGYSNIDRITELPFSTIKFDKSMVASSSLKDSSKFVVNSLCDIFSKLNLNILFEGIENDFDENMCIKMGANYLQGYKYSKPIPIEKMRKFLNKK